jgi:hypothetical protein
MDNAIRISALMPKGLYDQIPTAKGDYIRKAVEEKLHRDAEHDGYIRKAVEAQRKKDARRG